MSETSKNHSQPHLKTTLNFDELYKIIAEKVLLSPSQSYSARLAQGDIAKLVQKIGEEGVEVTIAGLLHEQYNSSKSRQDLINEVCDLFYHSLVLLVRHQISLEEIYQELYNRNNPK